MFFLFVLDLLSPFLVGWGWGVTGGGGCRYARESTDGVLRSEAEFLQQSDIEWVFLSFPQTHALARALAPSTACSHRLRLGTLPCVTPRYTFLNLKQRSESVKQKVQHGDRSTAVASHPSGELPSARVWKGVYSKGGGEAAAAGRGVIDGEDGLEGESKDSTGRDCYTSYLSVSFFCSFLSVRLLFCFCFRRATLARRCRARKRPF